MLASMSCRVAALSADILTTATGKPRDQILKDIDRDFYLSSPSAKEYGIIDDVLLPKKKQPKDKEDK